MRTAPPAAVTRAIIRTVTLDTGVAPSPCCDVAQAVVQLPELRAGCWAVVAGVRTRAPANALATVRSRVAPLDSMRRSVPAKRTRCAAGSQFVGTSRFSSSNQFCTIVTDPAVLSLGLLSLRNRWPSRETSYWRPANVGMDQTYELLRIVTGVPNTSGDSPSTLTLTNAPDESMKNNSLPLRAHEG